MAPFKTIQLLQNYTAPFKTIQLHSKLYSSIQNYTAPFKTIQLHSNYVNQTTKGYNYSRSENILPTNFILITLKIRKPQNSQHCWAEKCLDSRSVEISKVLLFSPIVKNLGYLSSHMIGSIVAKGTCCEGEGRSIWTFHFTDTSITIECSL